MPISDKTEFGQFTIAHPFAYSVTRDDFAQHIEENNLHCFVEEDPSNESEKPLRNFVRHVLVAELNNRKDVCLRSIVRDKWGWSGK
jgi:tRNA(Ile)-lysidine synthase TilS/MesJ